MAKNASKSWLIMNNLIKINKFHVYSSNEFFMNFKRHLRCDFIR